MEEESGEDEVSGGAEYEGVISAELCCWTSVAEWDSVVSEVEDDDESGADMPGMEDDSGGAEYMPGGDDMPGA